MDFEGVNRSLYLALNAPAGLAGISLHLVIGEAKYSILMLAGIVIWRWLRGVSPDRNALTHVVLADISALAINYVVGLVFFHPRPFMVGLGHTYLVNTPEASSPSDHATFMWTIAFGLMH
jgi:undecaprenyl-diphosphatase